MESDYEPHLSTNDDYHKECEAMVELESGKFGYVIFVYLFIFKFRDCL